MVKERRTILLYRWDMIEAITDYLVKIGYKREEVSTFNSEMQLISVDLTDIEKNEPNKGN